MKFFLVLFLFLINLFIYLFAAEPYFLTKEHG
jgi:hypothetical protein